MRVLSSTHFEQCTGLMTLQQFLAQRLLAAADAVDAGRSEPYDAAVYAEQAAKWEATRARDTARAAATSAKAER